MSRPIIIVSFKQNSDGGIAYNLEFETRRKFKFDEREAKTRFSHFVSAYLAEPGRSREFRNLSLQREYNNGNVDDARYVTTPESDSTDSSRNLDHDCSINTPESKSYSSQNSDDENEHNDQKPSQGGGAVGPHNPNQGGGSVGPPPCTPKALELEQNRYVDQYLQIEHHYEGMSFKCFHSLGKETCPEESRLSYAILLVIKPLPRHRDEITSSLWLN